MPATPRVQLCTLTLETDSRAFLSQLFR